MASEPSATSPNDFPVYRKYPGDRTYFKIHNFDAFEEVKRMGKYYEVHVYQASILPDRNLIEDMIHLNGPYWEEATPSEFENFKAYCEQELTLLQ